MMSFTLRHTTTDLHPLSPELGTTPHGCGALWPSLDAVDQEPSPESLGTARRVPPPRRTFPATLCMPQNQPPSVNGGPTMLARHWGNRHHPQVVRRQVMYLQRQRTYPIFTAQKYHGLGSPHQPSVNIAPQGQQAPTPNNASEIRTHDHDKASSALTCVFNNRARLSSVAAKVGCSSPRIFSCVA